MTLFLPGPGELFPRSYQADKAEPHNAFTREFYHPFTYVHRLTPNNEFDILINWCWWPKPSEPSKEMPKLFKWKLKPNGK